MKRLMVFMVLLILSVDASSYKLSNWYFGKSGKIIDWIASYEKAKKDSSQFEVVNDWQIGRDKRFHVGGSDLYGIAEINSDRDQKIEFSIMGSRADFRLNGKPIHHISQDRSIYPIDLKKGRNTIEVKLTKDQKYHFFLTQVESEYIYPTISQKVERARDAINYLKKKYSAYKGQDYLNELKSLENSSEQALESFLYKALVKNNPELDFSKILLRRTQHETLPINWRGNSQFTHSRGKVHKTNFNNSIEVLDLKSQEMKTLYEPENHQEGIMDIALDYDAKKFLYSGVNTETNTFELYEMSIDGKKKRQITKHIPEVDNYNGVYLPNGKILFCSTASLNSVPCVGGADYVGNLFEINRNGERMRQVTFDQENDWYPWVKENGRVMYHRWEYTDNSHYFTRIMMEMNPDGTNNRSIYGSNSYWPNSMFYAKQIPGKDSQFVGIVSGHHGRARSGELWIFDSSKGEQEGAGALRKIPGKGKTNEPHIIDNYTKGKWPMFVHPYPISENFFLVAGQARPGSRWEIYLVDVFDNMVKIASSPNHLMEPVPIKTRKKPPVVLGQRNLKQKSATIYIQDIHAGPGLKGIPRGEVAALRLFMYGYAYRNTGSHDALAIEGGWDTKRVLGTVPVEKDGSVMVKIPHSRPISIQPLDKDGNALQVMRSWIAAQPGEVVSCVGCHESSRMTPKTRRTRASRKAPKKMDIWSKYKKPYGFDFNREIQPILDKYCAGCHDGSKASPNFKDNSEQRFGRTKFSQSYRALHPYVRRPGPESDLHILTPMDYHTSTSELFQILKKGHHGVKVDDESMRQLATWVDLNVPYIATWLDYNGSQHIQDLAEKTKEYKRKYARINDDIEWMPPKDDKRPEFVEPRPIRRPSALKIPNWPLKKHSKKLPTKTLKIADEEITFVRIPSGQFVMGSVTGEMDEYPQATVKIAKPFWMSTTEITNKQFRAFKKDHDSRVIDQQWKDHIFPGYPANEDQMPVIRVSWKEAVMFTKWLSKEKKLKVNLPTEAQWEWAARAGSDKPHFFGTTGFEEYGNWADESIGLLAVHGVDPKPVPKNRRWPLNDFVPRDKSFNDGRLLPDGTAQYKPNPWGLYDMFGNVAEWTRSTYKSYPYNEKDGRNTLSIKGQKVVRGGSWRDRPKRATASYRLPYKSFQKVYNVGFRIIIEE